MNNIIDKLITVGVGLALLAGTWFIWFLSGVANNLFSSKKWSWRRMAEDVVKTFIMGISILAWVVVAEVLNWYTVQVGMDISQLLDGASITGLVAIICGGSGYYVAKAFRNFAKFIGTNHVATQVGNANYDAVAKPIKEFLETITTKSDKEHLADEGADDKQLEGTELSDEEAGMGGFANTYPEPYASAPQDSMTDPSTCYNREAQPAGTLITMADGSYKAVEDLKEGDLLFNHDGSQTVSVVSLWETAKPVYNIRTGAGDIRFTGEHPLYVRRNKWKALVRGNLKAFSDPQFVKTRELRIGDKVFLPELDGKGLGLSEDELRWLGFYLGDGTKASKSDQCPIYRLIVVDGRKRDYIDSLGVAGSYSVHSHTDKAKYFTLSKKYHETLRNILDGIDGKSFHYLVTPHDAKYIVEGYLMADGCKIRDNVYSASSTDKKLLLAIQRMVLSVGGTMSIHKRYDEGELEKFGTKVYAKTLWDASINLKPSRSRIHEFKDGKYATITDIKIGHQKKVYNIEVSGSHTYIADNHGVHNCVSYCAWKIKELTGSWPKRTGGMNAKYWLERLAENGYTKVVDTPKNGGKYVGVTTAGKYGHVNWFEEDNIVTEYNYASRGAFSVRAVDTKAYKWVEIQAPKDAATSAQTALEEVKKTKTNKDSSSKKKGDSSISYVYKSGDTFGQVIKNLGLATDHGLWGTDGDVNYYTQQLHQQGIYGNIPVGTTIVLAPRK